MFVGLQPLCVKYHVIVYYDEKSRLPVAHTRSRKEECLLLEVRNFNQPSNFIEEMERKQYSSIWALMNVMT